MSVSIRSKLLGAPHAQTRKTRQNLLAEIWQFAEKINERERNTAQAGIAKATPRN
jgi:hypothetical protein